MARQDTNTTQTFTRIALDSDDNVAIGTERQPVDATSGASFDCGTIEYTAALALVLAALRARMPEKAHKFVRETTRLRLAYRDHFDTVRTWKGSVWAAAKFVSERGAAREGTWAAGLLSVLATKVGAVDANEAIRQHNADTAAKWAELFDGMGREALPGIVGSCYLQLRTKGGRGTDGRGYHGGLLPSVKQAEYTGENFPRHTFIVQD